MKKTYIIPRMSFCVLQHETLLADSGVSSNNDIDYGGVDTEGEKDPDVKENFFDFEW